MMVTKELGDPFRRDALSKPVRHLAKYKKFVRAAARAATTRAGLGSAGSR